MKSLIGKAENAAKRETLSYETQDVEIQDFVARIKRRKKIRKIVSSVATGAAVVAGALVLAWLLGVL